MEKTISRLLALLLFCSLTLFGDKALYMEVNALYTKIPYASKEQTRQILHDLENFYINAVVQNDKRSIVKALKGIIKCQNLLGRDSSTYKKELYSLTGEKSSVHQRVSKSGKSPREKRGSGQASVSAANIRAISIRDNTLIVKFDRPISTGDVLSLHLHDKSGYKEVYDLHANLNFKAPRLRFTGIKRAKIAQNRYNKVRIVFQDKSKIYSKAFIRKGNLFIKINNPYTHTTPKSATFKPITQKPKIANAPRVPLPETTAAERATYATGKTIVIDAGHGGKDSGAVGYKHYQEKRAVLKVAKLLRKILKKQGYRVYLTRDSDRFIELTDRTHFANRKKADLFISIHANAAPRKQKLTLKGIETFFLSPAKTAKAKRIAAKENAASKKLDRLSKDTLLSFLNRTKIVQSNKLAIDIQSALLTKIRKKYDKVVDGGVREAPFWVLVGAQMPAVLVETGYITNPLEAERLFNPFYQKALAEGIATGINNYFAKNH
jgi:N-acetylmuramoyl-L-alanine amidase